MTTRDSRLPRPPSLEPAISREPLQVSFRKLFANDRGLFANAERATIVATSMNTGFRTLLGRTPYLATMAAPAPDLFEGRK